MKKWAAEETGGAGSNWTLAQAAGEIGVQRRLLKTWRARFALFETRGDRLSAQDLRALRALKALLVEHGYAAEQVQRLIGEEGAHAVIAAYGGARAAHPQTNPAHALQHAVRSAAAAGFFGPVYESVEDSAPEGAETPTPASYAQARLARLK